MKSPIVKRPVKETTERRISATLRLALVLVLLLVNVAAVMLLSYFLQAHSAIVLTLIIEAAAIGVAINIQSSSSSASYKLAWTLLVVAVPVAGLILYVLWGGNIQSKRLNLLPVKLPESREAEKRQSEANLERLGEVLPNWRRTAAMLAGREFLLYRETDVTYFPGGDAQRDLPGVRRGEQIAVDAVALPVAVFPPGHGKGHGVARVSGHRRAAPVLWR